MHIYYFKSPDEDQIPMKKMEEGFEGRVTSWQVEGKQENTEPQRLEGKKRLKT